MEEDEPEFLYHYTDQSGLDGILSSDCMWATHFKFLNDISEREHGFAFFDRAINETCACEEPSLGVSRANLEDFGLALRQTLRNYYEITSLFVVSFTTDRPDEIKSKSGGDRLSQWRGYALGKQGYCLVFDYATIERIGNNVHKSNKLSGWLKNCLYRDEYKLDLAKQTIKPIFDAYVQEIQAAPPSSISVQPFKDPKGNAMKAFNEENSKAIFRYNIMKDVSFAEENEVRLSVTFVNDRSDVSLVRFRDGRNGKVPYVEIPVGIRGPIPSLRKIVVGPSEQKEQQAALLRLRLQELGISGVDVISSKIPYRNW